MRLILFLCVTLAAGAFSTGVFAQAMSAPLTKGDMPPLSQPVLEAAVFRVAPVAAGATDARLHRTPGSGPALRGPGTEHRERVVEVRAQKGERWQELLPRMATALSVKLPMDATLVRQDVLPQLQPGKYLRASIPTEGTLEVEYVVSVEEAYALHITPAALQVRPLARDARLIERMRADPAKASLFTATDAVGLPENIALQLTEIFAGEVDFLRELHLGYRCAIVYEAHYREGFIEPSGRILAAELDVGKRSLHAYYALDKQGRGAYFDSTGRSTRRLFRRTPLEFTRVTSDYTLARFHPILGVWTAHRGVDYAAPIGTKIMSVADGIVDFMGQRGGYGNLVVIRHQDIYRTYYAHMNAFAPKLAVGSKVSQGETIGTVGMTGLATGPHLHFEFHVRNAQGEWTSVPAPEVIETTITAAPGFADKVRVYRDSLAVAEQSNVLILQ